jgi:N-acetylglutamate synthase-like GNAT family acetyltransferase
MSEILIKIYEDTYKNQVIELILDIQNKEYNLGFTIEDQSELLSIKENYIDKGGSFWVAVTTNNKVIGTIAIDRLTFNIAVLRKMFVAKEFRELGVAQNLFNKLIDFVKKEQINTILLDTPGVATTSHRFYEKNGFVQIDKDAIPENYKYPDKNSKIYKLQIIAE